MAEETENNCPVGQEDCEIIDAASNLQQRIADLETQVQTDPLTGLINFRGFEERLEQEMERTRRLEEPTSLMMIDIDHFKRVNDTHGHDVGNQALIHIASLLRQTLRKLDIPCRFGGEEFVLILPSTHLVPAIQVAERIRCLIEKTPLRIDRNKVAMTISLGVESFTPLGNQSAAELLKSVDSYLYQAKNSGRNRTCHPPIDLDLEKGAVGSQERRDLFAAFGRKDQ
jgi:diguanylate cyclase (GGDEF)-like protein